MDEYPVIDARLSSYAYEYANPEADIKHHLGQGDQCFQLLLTFRGTYE